MSRRRKKQTPKPTVRRSLVMEILTQNSGPDDTSQNTPLGAQDASQPSIGIPKKLRYKNNSNLKRIRALPCFVCGASPPNDPDHLQSVGAGGGDHLENLNALCRPHHVERHTIGLNRFIERYYSVITATREKFELPEMILPYLD